METTFRSACTVGSGSFSHLKLYRNHFCKYRRQHLFTVCNKASQKLDALARASMYMPKEKTRVVMRAFEIFQFSYCPSKWMFHDRGVNSNINHIHERAVRIAYQDFTSSFAELLINDN